jgi:CheY-like chemotaxis protein
LVLLVDDEELVRVASQAMLERLGYRVLTAVDGREALELFRARADDVACVLLDLLMPNMDGERTLHELRRLRPDVRVIVASGYSREKAAARLGDGTPTAFLKKPFDEGELEEKLRSVLDG